MTEHFRPVEGEQAEAREHLAQKRNATKQPLYDWDAPDWSILDDHRGELPDFPLDCLPPLVREWVERGARGAGVTSAHVAVPVLGISSSLIGMARRVKASSSWISPVTCWTVVVGASGTGKTPGIDVSKRALDDVSRNNRSKVVELRRQHETKAEAAKAARTQWKKQVEEAIAAGQGAPPMPEEATDPGPFIEARPYITDVTIERIGELLQARPQGTLLLRDELSALFLNMSRYSGGQDNAFWLEAWNGGSSVVERMSRSLYLKHLLVGVVGGIQPNLLETSFKGDLDGMYTRFLFAWPPKAVYRPLTDIAEEFDPDIVNVITRLERLAEFADGNLVTREIILSVEARTEFEGLRQWADREQEAFDGREREWMAKATAHVLRLSGTLCLLDWATRGGEEPTAVGADYMRAAIRLIKDYFWPHARAALRQIGLSDRHVNARRALRWVKACRGPGQEISIEDIRRDALGQKLDAEQTVDLLAAMERSGWVREKKTEARGRGRPARRWEANPLLLRLAENAENAENRFSAIPAIPASARELQPEAYGGAAPASPAGSPPVALCPPPQPVETQPATNGKGGHAQGNPSDDGIPEVLRRCDHCGRAGAKAQDFNGRTVYLHDDCHHGWADALAKVNPPAQTIPETEPPARTNGAQHQAATEKQPVEKAPPAADVISAPDPVPSPPVRPMLPGDLHREQIRARNQEAVRRSEAEIKARTH